MDFARVEGYLRSACSVLDFDIGEFWNAEKLVGEEFFLRHSNEVLGQELYLHSF